MDFMLDMGLNLLNPVKEGLPDGVAIEEVSMRSVNPDFIVSHGNLVG